MIALPPLLLTANVPSVFGVCTRLLEAADPVICDASEVLVAEPMALCALVATLSRMQRAGRNVQVVGLSPRFKRQLEDLDILSKSLHLAESEVNIGYQGTLHAYRVKNESDGNRVGNEIAKSIANLIPSSQPAISALDAQSEYRAVVFPLAYVFTELIDNGIRHGRGRGYSHSSVWLSAQFHPPLGFIRLAVADDGCGFLLTLKGRDDLKVSSHADAIRAAFRPFTSSKRDVGLFADSQHQGLGLTICRDLAGRSEGHVTVVTGNAWISNPELETEHSRAAPFWQGAVVSVELRLPALNTLNFREITCRYNPNPDLPLRFM